MKFLATEDQYAMKKKKPVIDEQPQDIYENLRGDECQDQDESFQEHAVDYAAAKEYLGLKMAKPEELARLAAMMAPKMDGFDPAALIDAAINLSTVVTARIELRRDSILNAMNSSTAQHLAWQLGIPRSIKPDKRIGILLNDPFVKRIYWKVAPLIFRLNAMHKDIDPWEYKGADMLESGFEMFDKRTRRPRPNPPCSLETALAYIADAPSGSTGALKEAYIDWSVIYPHEVLLKEEEEKRGNMQLAMATITEELENEDPDSARRNELDDLYKVVKVHRDALDEISRFRKSFSPGKRFPASISPWVKSLAESWNQPDSVDKWLMMELLWSNFGEFWEMHGGTYLERQQACGKSLGGVQSRELKKWLAHTEKYVEQLKLLNKPQTNEKIIAHITTHAATVEGVKDQRTRDLLSHFLLTLFEFVDAENSDSLGDLVVRKLKQGPDNRDAETRTTTKIATGAKAKVTGIRFKAAPYRAVTDQTAIECLNILREALGKKVIPVIVHDSIKKPQKPKREPVIATHSAPLGKKQKKTKEELVQRKSEGKWAPKAGRKDSSQSDRFGY